MRRTVIALVLLLSVTACGGGDDAPVSAEVVGSTTPSTDEATSPAASPSAVAAVGLREACPQMEAALPSAVVPTASRWQEFSVMLAELSETGDVEAKNAIAILKPSVDDLAADPASGQPYLDAFSSLTGSLETLASRCKSVGSSAFQ